MATPRVLIIGCGVAGPVIALLLKRKGYAPIVLEKVRELGDAGASLMMMPNGLKVLELVELAETVTRSAPHLELSCDRASSGTEIGSMDFPSQWKEKYGQPACGVKRTALSLALKVALQKADVEMREGWKLRDIVETETSVIAISEIGEKIEGSFLIGCDGIQAVSRSLVLKQHGIVEEQASFTGLTQTAGMSPTPPSLQSQPILFNIYGPSAHFICYPVSSTTTSWAITQRDLTEAQETWRVFSRLEMVENRSQLLDQFNEWCSPIPELIRGTERIIKYGLYDRPQLEPEQWYSSTFGRCVLIGDAAHPTSPHLGQGANQAMEDCYHLSQLLPDLESRNEATISSEELKSTFGKFAKMRQPRTAALVKGARAQGENRVVDGGPDACAARDERLRKAWEDKARVESMLDGLLKEPY